jgi:CheY-like chemotaxis protein
MTKSLAGLLNSPDRLFDPNSSQNARVQQQVLPCVLVVDNRSADTLILSHYLRQCGCVYHIAATCEAATARLESHPYDFILADIRTLDDDKSGLLSLVRGRERGGKQRTQIIAMSAFAFDDARNGGGFNFDGYLAKPCNPQLLAEMLGVRYLDFQEP